MRNYVCIGGPNHGQTIALPEGRRELVVADAPTFLPLTLRNELDPFGPVPRNTRYTVKTIGFSEQLESPPFRHNTRVRIRAEVNVDVLQHESVLTIEETVAQYRKLRPNDFKDAADFTLSLRPLFSK